MGIAFGTAGAGFIADSRSVAIRAARTSIVATIVGAVEDGVAPSGIARYDQLAL